MIEPGYVLRNRYRIIRTVGRGGMADVYLAFDERRQVHVAVKVLREDLAEDPEFIRRFQREALALAQLDHPNIVRFYSFEREGVIAFMVLDYVAGVTLRRYMAERGGPLALGEVTWILRSVGAALHYAHSEGIVHRDVKPGNIMLREDGQVLVSDFGIAKVMASATVTTFAVGTPAYMSPEQILGREITPASDIYSLGVVLYQMVTGRRPFTGEEAGLTGSGTLARLREAHLRLKPVDPRRYNKGLSEGAAGVVLRALAKAPGERWPDVASMVRAWEGAMEAAGIQATAPVVRAGGLKAVERPGTRTGTGSHPATSRPITGGYVTPSGPGGMVEATPVASSRTVFSAALAGAIAAISILLIIGGGLALFVLRGGSGKPVNSSLISPAAVIVTKAPSPVSGDENATVISRSKVESVWVNFNNMTVGAYVAYLHAEPPSGKSVRALAVLSRNTPLKLVAGAPVETMVSAECPSGRWWHVIVTRGRSRGKEGWVCADKVQGETVPLREGASSNSARLTFVRPGTRVIILAGPVQEKSGGTGKDCPSHTWWRVRLENASRLEGWICQDHLLGINGETVRSTPEGISVITKQEVTPTPTWTPTFTPTRTPTPTWTPTLTRTPTPTPTPTPYARVAVQVANFRAGPGTVYDVIGRYRQGTVMRLRGRYDGWYYMVAPDGKRGWMAGSILILYGNVNALPRLTPPPTPTPRPTPTPTWTPTPRPTPTPPPPPPSRPTPTPPPPPPTPTWTPRP